MRLFAGDDWAGDHHDVELMDAAGRRLAKARPPEGVAGVARLHAMIGEQPGEDADDEEDAGQVAVRTDSHQLRAVAGDTAQAAAFKVVTRTHNTLIWERTRCTQRLRHALRDYFPAALEAFEDLDAPGALELLARAPDPASAAGLTTAQISAALKRARRRGIRAKAQRIQAVLRAGHLGQPAIVTAAYATPVRALAAVLGTLNEQAEALQGQVEAYFGQHPDAEIELPQPGLGPILGARVLAESGDAPVRYLSAKARKNYARASPITRASEKKKTVTARYIPNDRLTGILNGCLKTRTLYDEATAWPQYAATAKDAAA